MVVSDTLYLPQKCDHTEDISSYGSATNKNTHPWLPPRYQSSITHPWSGMTTTKPGLYKHDLSCQSFEFSIDPFMCASQWTTDWERLSTRASIELSKMIFVSAGFTFERTCELLIKSFELVYYICTHDACSWIDGRFHDSSIENNRGKLAPPGVHLIRFFLRALFESTDDARCWRGRVLKVRPNMLWFSNLSEDLEPSSKGFDLWNLFDVALYTA